MNLNRTIAPAINPISSINWLKHTEETLSNGSRVYLLGGPFPELSKIEFIFRAGNKYQRTLLAGNYAATLMKEGTKFTAAGPFNEQIDFYGAFLSVDFDRDYCTVTLHSLNKFLPELLPMVAEMIIDPAYPEDILAVKTRNAVQQLNTDMGKVSYRARRRITELVMGSDHYYGVMPTAEHYEALTTEEVRLFHVSNFFSEPPVIMVSGNVPSTITGLLEKSFGSVHYNVSREFEKRPTEIITGLERVAMENTMQSGIRYGKSTIMPEHEDADALEIAVMLLGGFFGSRLMKNLREDKGYTYGVHAGILQLQETSMLTIGTEIGNEHVDHALEEIDREIRILTQTEPKEEELSVIKNYMTGQMVKDADGPMAQSDLLRFRVLNNLDEDHHQQMLERINAITPEEVLMAADNYMQVESFAKVVAG
ncbi:MAG: pitrilysin family protein [Bacteroidota bacterium]